MEGYPERSGSGAWETLYFACSRPLPAWKTPRPRRLLAPAHFPSNKLKSIPINAEGLKPPNSTNRSQSLAAFPHTDHRTFNERLCQRQKSSNRDNSSVAIFARWLRKSHKTRQNRQKTSQRRTLDVIRSLEAKAGSSRAVRRFLDVAAVEVNGDDGEDDPDEDNDDFIDVDEPRHDFGPKPHYTPLLPDDLLNFGPKGDELKKAPPAITNLCSLVVSRIADSSSVLVLWAWAPSWFLLSLRRVFINEDIAEGGLMDVGEDTGIKAVIVALQIWAHNFNMGWDYPSPSPPVACLDTKRNQSGSTPHCGEPARSQRVSGLVDVGKPKRIGDEGQDREHQGRVGLSQRDSTSQGQEGFSQQPPRPSQDGEILLGIYTNYKRV
ncbi:hypothetical protein C8F01DRAFT_1092083 [Mycena amicta]|nr:hypothetical protein C8F01DRAFT_1092083 [Mycena amicta]